jgi:high-affinity nickel-transport protein
VFSALGSLDINAIGFVVVGLFVATWIVAVLIWRLGSIERRFSTSAAEARI